jgi:hypothetical protein
MEWNAAMKTVSVKWADVLDDTSFLGEQVNYI